MGQWDGLQGQSLRSNLLTAGRPAIGQLSGSVFLGPGHFAGSWASCWLLALLLAARSGIHLPLPDMHIGSACSVPGPRFEEPGEIQ